MLVAPYRAWSHNVGMRNSSDVMAVKMATEGHRLRHIREKVGASKFARAAHLALTSNKTFDEALAEEGLGEWKDPFLQAHAR